MLPLIAAVLFAPRPVQLIFVRHGETVANATGRYNSKTIDTFSERGEQQVGRLTQELGKLRFDAIVVSPSPRALKTIAPYLRAHPGVRAEVWPELYECCDAHSKKIKGLTSAQVRFGGPVVIPKGLEGLFTVAPGNSRMILAPSYDDGLRQIRLAADHLRRTFAGTGKSVLVVGHSLHGGRLLELLQGKTMQGKIRPDNCRPMFFRESGGAFVPAVAAR